MANTRSSAFEFKRGSWLKNVKANTLSDGVESWGFFDDVPDVRPRDTDVFFVIDRVMRPEQIASDFYGRPELWWIIAIANDVRVPLVELHPGRRLRIPSPVEILQQVQREGSVVG